MALSDRIRPQLQQHTTDDLLRVWVENNRAVWSPAAFEAIQSILTERGIALPPQNLRQARPATAPAVRRSQLVLNEDVRLHMLRGMALVGVCIGISGLLSGMLAPIEGLARSRSVGTMWLWDPLAVASCVMRAGLSLLLLIGSIAASRHKPGGHRLLLWYARVAVGSQITLMAVQVSSMVASAGSAEVLRELRWGSAGLYAAVSEAAFPLLILLLLGHPQTRELIATPTRGFEVVAEPRAVADSPGPSES